MNGSSNSTSKLSEINATRTLTNTIVSISSAPVASLTSMSAEVSTSIVDTSSTSFLMNRDNSEIRNQVFPMEEMGADFFSSIQHSTSKDTVFMRSLPVIFVVLLIAALYTIFALYHCIPLLQIDVSPSERHEPSFNKGLVEFIVFNIIMTFLLLSFGLSIITPPGSIPDKDEWHISSDEDIISYNINEASAASPAETKRKGGKRRCKWCLKLKPDRAHHCRVCRKCILKMDHHCPWIYNCVGWGNHKYFMLSLLYGSAASIFIGVAMFESVMKALNHPVVPFGEMFLLLFGETLDLFLGVIVVGFFFFHIWLTMNGLTTIEFCEKQVMWSHGSRHLWNRGCWMNFTDVFGSNPLLWLIPIDNRQGDGINFVTESTRLLADVQDNEFRKIHRVANEKNSDEIMQFNPIIEQQYLTPTMVDNETN